MDTVGQRAGKDAGQSAGKRARKGATGLGLLVAASLLAATSAWGAPSCYDETKIGTSSEMEGVPTGSDFSGPMQFKDGGVVSGYGRVIYAIGQLNSPTSKQDTNILDNSAKGFENFLKSANVQPGTLVVFHSPGGSVAAGLAIGEAIRKRSLRTTVGQPQAANASSPLATLATAAPTKGVCASACSMAFLGGTRRTVRTSGIPTGSLYGVHAVEVEDVPQNVTLAELFWQGQVEAAQIGAYLAEMGVDPSWLVVADQCAAGLGQIQFMTPAQLTQTKTITAFTTSWSLSDDNGLFVLAGNNPDSSSIPGFSDDVIFGCVGTPRNVEMRIDYLPESYNAGQRGVGGRSTPQAFTTSVSGYSLSGFKANSVATGQSTVLNIAKSDVVAPLPVAAADSHHVTTTIAVTPSIANLLKQADTLQFSFKGQTAPVGQVNFDLSEGHQFINDYIAACH
jgi:hypothetical protein